MPHAPATDSEGIAYRVATVADERYRISLASLTQAGFCFRALAVRTPRALDEDGFFNRVVLFIRQHPHRIGKEIT